MLIVLRKQSTDGYLPAYVLFAHIQRISLNPIAVVEIDKYRYIDFCQISYADRFGVILKFSFQ